LQIEVGVYESCLTICVIFMREMCTRQWCPTISVTNKHREEVHSVRVNDTHN